MLGLRELVCFAFVLLVFATTWDLGAGASANTFAGFRKHMALVESYKCKNASYIVLDWREVVPEEHHKDVMRMNPSFTVLKRCDPKCGVCSPEEVCSRKTTEEEDKVLVFHKIMGGKKNEFISVTVSEDKECHCVKKNPKDIK